jgi:hypothetical protein
LIIDNQNCSSIFSQSSNPCFYHNFNPKAPNLMKTEKYAIREFQIELNKIFGKNFVENLIKIQDVRAIKLRSRKKIYFCKPCLDLLCKRENKIEIFRNKEIMKVKSNCKKNKSEIDDELFRLNSGKKTYCFLKLKEFKTNRCVCFVCEGGKVINKKNGFAINSIERAKRNQFLLEIFKDKNESDGEEILNFFDKLFEVIPEKYQYVCNEHYQKNY